ncbi:MAG: hypothetical protein AMJ43_07080 [Coxiella sp. DG_40]|nr:MAG: hypothetical protein AMJ43_07080 [Coxiella sp. DG_40]
MNRKKSSQSKTKGSAMALILIALVVILIMGIGTLELGLRSRLFAIRTASEIAARCAADAGLTKCLYEMNQKLKVKPWNGGSMPVALHEQLANSDATFSYTVTPDANNRYIVNSFGQSGPVRRKVTSTFKLEGLFEYAIFTQGIMTLRNGTTISAYNLDAGDPPLQIGTNSTQVGAITSKLGVTIDGDVIVGVGGNPNTVINSCLEGVITGNTYSLPETHKTPPITVPEYLLNMPSSGTITTSTTITNSAKYDAISLTGTSNAITINGAVELYVIGSIRLGNTCQIKIVDATTNPNASLTLYVGGNILFDNGSAINNLSMDAHKLKIYGLDTCTKIDLKNSGTFYGAIYAPNADIHLYNNSEIYGSIVGKTFVQDVGANVHYDASLRNASVNDIGVKFVVRNWHEE